MHSTPSDGSSGDEVERTVQGTLDRFVRVAKVRDSDVPDDRSVEPRGVVLTATAAVDRPSAPEQRSIDAFTADDYPPTPELEARAPRAMAALALEREIERVARREATTGVSRDELVIAVARECNVPLEDLTLVDGYISDLVLEGKLRLVGERVLLAPAPRELPAATGGPRNAGGTGPRAQKRSAKRKGRQGHKGKGKRRQGQKGRATGRRRGRGARASGGDDG